MKLTPACTFFLFAICHLGHGVAVGAEEDVHARRAAAETIYAARLKKLADRCDQLGLPEQARATRDWQIPRDPYRLYLFLPAQSIKQEVSQPPENADQKTKYVAAWQKHFHAARNEQADRLVELAKEALKQDYPASAYQWLHEALHENPDHETARAALDYRIVNGRWRLPGGSPRATRVRIANRKYQLASGHYRIESEHFRLLTDDTKEAGLAAVQELETVYALWRQAFYRFWGGTPQLRQKLDAAAAPRRSSRKFAVVLFRDRQKYIEVLSKTQPLIGKSVGIYMDKQRTAFFYSGDDSLATRRHEAAHQFFSESISGSKDVGMRHNFWVVEAIALYMESLVEHEGFYTLGGMDANRTQYARYRAYNQRFYAPLADLTAFSRDQLQKHDYVARFYSQSAGLAGYFLDRAGPERRVAFLEFVREVYRGRDNADTLAKTLGAELKNVDREYLQSLMVSDENLAIWPQTKWVNLSLGNTLVTDQGLAKILPQAELRWLDLAATEVGDDVGPLLAECKSMEQLNLEKTKITDRILPYLGKLDQLVELDLSNTAITGKSLRHLDGLENLQVLWLTDTDVSDSDLDALAKLKKLQTLNVNGTSVSADGLRKLRASLPNLQP